MAGNCENHEMVVEVLQKIEISLARGDGRFERLEEKIDGANRMMAELVRMFEELRKASDERFRDIETGCPVLNQRVATSEKRLDTLEGRIWWALGGGFSALAAVAWSLFKDALSK